MRNESKYEKSFSMALGCEPVRPAQVEDMRNGSVLKSVACAAKGLLYAFKTQRNVRIHFIAAVLVLAGGILLKFSATELSLLAIAITFVVAAELANTAIENLADVVSEEFHPRIMVVKDIAAASVLVGAIGAILVGLLLFIPRVILF